MIITIGRSHGSNGHDVAKALAKELGYVCYDKEIVDHAAENTGFSKEIFASYDEKRVSAYVVPSPHYMGMSEGYRLNTKIATAQFEAIRTLAEEGNCIFVGRCADYVLRNRKDLVSIFVKARESFRISTLMERKELKADQARRLMKEVDKDRASFYKYYTDQIWGEAENYDLVIDSGKIGVEGVVEVIKSYIAQKEKSLES